MCFQTLFQVGARQKPTASPKTGGSTWATSHPPATRCPPVGRLLLGFRGDLQLGAQGLGDGVEGRQVPHVLLPGRRVEDAPRVCGRDPPPHPSTAVPGDDHPATSLRPRAASLAGAHVGRAGRQRGHVGHLRFEDLARDARRNAMNI